jgi:hypothetical protein
MPGRLALDLLIYTRCKWSAGVCVMVEVVLATGETGSICALAGTDNPIAGDAATRVQFLADCQKRLLEANAGGSSGPAPMALRAVRDAATPAATIAEAPAAPGSLSGSGGDVERIAEECAAQAGPALLALGCSGQCKITRKI